LGGSLKAKGFGDGNAGETIPNRFDFAQEIAAIEIATLPNYEIKYHKARSPFD